MMVLRNPPPAFYGAHSCRGYGTACQSHDVELNDEVSLLDRDPEDMDRMRERIRNLNEEIHVRESRLVVSNRTNQQLQRQNGSLQNCLLSTCCVLFSCIYYNVYPMANG